MGTGDSIRNAAEDERGRAPGGGEPGIPAQDSPADGGMDGNILPGDSGAGMPGASNGQPGTGQPGAADTAEGTAEGTAGPARSVPGPGGLPDFDPDVLRADPTEADQDPSTGMGRG